MSDLGSANLVTVADVEHAAETLQKLSIIYEYGEPQFGQWCAEDLRREITHIADYVAQGDVIDTIVKRVKEHVGAPFDLGDVMRLVLRDYEIRAIE